MTLTSELTQLILLIFTPIIPIVGVYLFYLKKIPLTFLVIFLLLTSLYLAHTLVYSSYTIFGIGVGCTKGERMVEVPPSNFSRIGDQQQCVKDDIYSHIAESLALARPYLTLISYSLTNIICIFSILVLLRRSNNGSLTS